MIRRFGDDRVSGWNKSDSAMDACLESLKRPLLSFPWAVLVSLRRACN